METPSTTIEAKRESPWVRRLANTSIALVTASTASAVLGAVSSVYATHGDDAFRASAVAITLAALAAALMLESRRRARRLAASPTSTVIATAEQLVVESETFAVSTLESGTIRPRRRPAGPVYDIELTRPWRATLRLQTTDLQGARRLLDVLGLGASARVMTRQVMSRVNTPWLMVPITLLLPTSVPIAIIVQELTGERAGYVLFPLSFFLAFIAMGFGLIKTRVTIGPETITTSWLGLRRTVALLDVVDLEVTRATTTRPSCVRLALRGGGRFDIAVGSRGHHLFEPYSLDEEGAILRERIEDALRRASSPTVPFAA